MHSLLSPHTHTHTHPNSLSCVWRRCHGRAHLCVSVVSLSHWSPSLSNSTTSPALRLCKPRAVNNSRELAQVHTPSGHTHSTVLLAGLRDMGTTFKPMCLNNTSHLSMLDVRWRALLSPCYVRNPPNSPLRRKKCAGTKQSLISGAVHFSSPNRLLKTFMSRNKTLYASLSRPNPWYETQQSRDVFWMSR